MAILAICQRHGAGFEEIEHRRTIPAKLLSRNAQLLSGQGVAASASQLQIARNETENAWIDTPIHALRRRRASDQSRDRMPQQLVCRQPADTGKPLRSRAAASAETRTRPARLHANWYPPRIRSAGMLRSKTR